MKKSKSTNMWVIITAVLVVILVALEIVSDGLIGSASVASDTYGPFAGYVSLVAIFTFIISTIAVFKTESWAKLVPISGMLIALVIFGLAFFAFSFSGYGSPS